MKAKFEALAESGGRSAVRKAIEKKHAQPENTSFVFKTQSGPPVADKCPECGSTLHVRQDGPLAAAMTFFSHSVCSLLGQCGVARCTTLPLWVKC